MGATDFRVSGVRECFSYRQCLRYLTQRLQVGMALLHLDFLLRHSLQAWSAKPRGVSRSPKPAPSSKARSDDAKAELASAKGASAAGEGEWSSMVIEMGSRVADGAGGGGREEEAEPGRWK